MSPVPWFVILCATLSSSSHMPPLLLLLLWSFLEKRTSYLLPTTYHLLPNYQLLLLNGHLLSLQRLLCVCSNRSVDASVMLCRVRGFLCYSAAAPYHTPPLPPAAQRRGWDRKRVRNARFVPRRILHQAIPHAPMLPDASDSVAAPRGFGLQHSNF